MAGTPVLGVRLELSHPCGTISVVARHVDDEIPLGRTSVAVDHLDSRAVARRHLIEIVDDVMGPDPQLALWAVARLRDDMVPWLELRAVSRARHDGWNWAEIGRVLRRSRQAVRQRFADADPLVRFPHPDRGRVEREYARLMASIARRRDFTDDEPVAW